MIEQQHLALAGDYYSLALYAFYLREEDEEIKEVDTSGIIKEIEGRTEEPLFQSNVQNEEREMEL